MLSLLTIVLIAAAGLAIVLGAYYVYQRMPSHMVAIMPNNSKLYVTDAVELSAKKSDAQTLEIGKDAQNAKFVYITNPKTKNSIAWLKSQGFFMAAKALDLTYEKGLLKHCCGFGYLAADKSTMQLKWVTEASDATVFKFEKL